MKVTPLKSFLGLLIIAIIIAGIYLVSARAGGEEATGEMRYKEFAVERGTFRVMVSATGIVQPINRIEIKSKASGRIDVIPVEEGDFVRKGALICRLDQTDVQAEVDQAQADLDIAEAELKQAENTYNRRQKLFEKNLISEEELDQTILQLATAKGKMVRAQTSLSQAETRLSETVVTAPSDGVILQKFVEAGQIIASGINNVSGGSPIADIADMSKVYIEAGIDEIDVGKISIGQDAVVIAEAYPRQEFHGKIIRIAPEARVEQNVTLFDVIIEVANPEAKLKSGMNANVEITIVEKDNVLLLPTLALNGNAFSPGTPGFGSGQRPQGMGQSGQAGRPRPQGIGNPGQERHPSGDAPNAKDRAKGSMPQTREVLVKEGDEFVPRDITVGLSDFKHAIVLSGLTEGDTVGVPMTSRLKAENDRMEERIRSSRSFGASSNSSSRGGK